MKTIRFLMPLCLLFLCGCGANHVVDGNGMINSWENQLSLTDWHSLNRDVSYRLHFDDDVGPYKKRDETAYGTVSIYENETLLESYIYTIDLNQGIIMACDEDSFGAFAQFSYMEDPASDLDYLKGKKQDGSEVTFERMKGT